MSTDHTTDCSALEHTAICCYIQMINHGGQHEGAIMTARRLSKKTANELWDKVWDALANTEEAIREVIEKRAWEPLGYETFADAWLDRGKDKTPLAQEIRHQVVYQMFSEGLTADEIADAVAGVTPDAAERLNRQRKNGVPPEGATTVRSHQRSTRPHTLHLYVGAEQMEEYHRIVSALGEPSTAVMTHAIKAIEKRFRELDNEARA